MGALCVKEEDKEERNQITKQSQQQSQNGNSASQQQQQSQNYQQIKVEQPLQPTDNMLLSEKVDIDAVVKILIGYWNIRGLGQIPRYLLEFTGLEYEEKRYTNRPDWFEKDKQGLMLEFANLPYLIQGSYKLTESSAIEDYIIHKSGKLDLLGSTIQEQATVKMLHVIVKELMRGLMRICFDKDFETQRPQQWEKKFQPQLKNIVKFLGEKEFLIGKITHPDFVLYEALMYAKGIYGEAALKEFPTLARYIISFENQPKIKSYIESTRFLKAPFLPSDMQANNVDIVSHSLQNGEKSNVQQQELPKTYAEEPQPTLSNPIHLKIAYWDGIRARAAVSKALLAYTGVSHEVKNYKGQNWQEWFEQDKVQMGEKFAFPNLPYLVDGELILSESKAIEQYIVSRSGKTELFGKSDSDKSLVLQLQSIIQEISDIHYKLVLHATDFATEVETYYEKNIKTKLDQLLTFLGNKDFLLGYLTIADFTLYELLLTFSELYYEELKSFGKLDIVQKYLSSFESLPEIKKYIESSANYIHRPFYYPNFIAKWIGGVEEVPRGKISIKYMKGVKGFFSPLLTLIEYFGLTYSLIPCEEGDQDYYLQKGHMKIAFSEENIKNVQNFILKLKENTLFTHLEENKNLIAIAGELLNYLLSNSGKTMEEFIGSRKALYTNVKGHLEQLSAALADKTYFLGNEVSLADFYIFESLLYVRGMLPNALKQFENLATYVSNFENQEFYQNYTKSDRFMSNFQPVGACVWTGQKIDYEEDETAEEKIEQQQQEEAVQEASEVEQEAKKVEQEANEVEQEAKKVEEEANVVEQEAKEVEQEAKEVEQEAKEVEQEELPQHNEQQQQKEQEQNEQQQNVETEQEQKVSEQVEENVDGAEKVEEKEEQQVEENVDGAEKVKEKEEQQVESNQEEVQRLQEQEQVTEQTEQQNEQQQQVVENQEQEQVPVEQKEAENEKEQVDVEHKEEDESAKNIANQVVEQVVESAMNEEQEKEQSKEDEPKVEQQKEDEPKVEQQKEEEEKNKNQNEQENAEKQEENKDIANEEEQEGQEEEGENAEEEDENLKDSQVSQSSQPEKKKKRKGKKNRN